MGPSGVLLYPKPAGVTSHDVVAGVRRGLREEHGKVKVGHAGTLDPFATGLLLVLVGRATRAQRFLMGLPKTYRTVARLGWVSDTGDRDGELTQTGNVPVDPMIPVGEQMQRPPAYSAVKVDGERLYERARRGDPVEGEARPVTVYRAERLSLDGERAEFEIECSAGTYIRQLVAALGRRLLRGARAHRRSVTSASRTPTRARLVPLASGAGLHAGARADRRAGGGDAPRARIRLGGSRARRGTRGSSTRASFWPIGRPDAGRMKPVVVFTT